MELFKRKKVLTSRIKYMPFDPGQTIMAKLGSKIYYLLDSPPDVPYFKIEVNVLEQNKKGFTNAK